VWGNPGLSEGKSTGSAASFPAIPAALVFIGSNLGGMAAEIANDVYQDELEEFNRWMAK
jgi:hypothetical protein